MIVNNLESQKEVKSKDNDLVKKEEKAKPAFNPLDALESELSKEMKFTESNLLNEDYSKFLDNPQVSQFMSNYYYDIPSNYALNSSPY